MGMILSIVGKWPGKYQDGSCLLWGQVIPLRCVTHMITVCLTYTGKGQFLWEKAALEASEEGPLGALGAVNQTEVILEGS